MSDVILCAHSGCDQRVANNRWAKTRATGWFFQKDGTAWCPEHIPEWLDEWRTYKQKVST